MLDTDTLLYTEVVKRDGSIVSFDEEKIRYAIARCLASVYDVPVDSILDESLNMIVNFALSILYARCGEFGIPTVEQIQDCVEVALQACKEYQAAKHYILYRAEHAKKRQEVPLEVRQAFEQDNVYFPTAIQRFQFLDKYSRWDYTLGRRETWLETTSRAVDYLHELASPYSDLGSEFYMDILEAIRKLEVMPSMRLMAMAGPAARRDNVSIYNCAYFPVDSLESFCENMLVSMAGCGVGYSVESQYVRKLPQIKQQTFGSRQLWIVVDNAEGWAEALRAGLELWFNGQDIEFDYSLIRKAGMPLRTKGGRASGPKPLEELLTYMRGVILSKQGRQLTTLDAHDMMCKIGDAVVSGGVRRTALISLFDADDMNMLTAKNGNFESKAPQRWNANNSAVWTNNSNMTQAQFLDFFKNMLDSQRGEPGIFSRESALNMMPDRRRNLASNKNVIWGTNPCGEILLRPRQFCNLTDIVATSEDTRYTLCQKAKLAAQIGTIQSLATHFPNLSKEWSNNCEEERLLGVGLSGQIDARVELTSPYTMRALQFEVIKENIRLAQQLNINPSTSTTCVKPNGNSSILTGASSGLHARWAPYYIRNVRVSATSSLAKVLQDAGVPLSPENGQEATNPNTWVVSFPIAAPKDTITRKDYPALEQCDWWYHNKINWTEHNPSVTITYTPNEVIDLTKWVWEHKDELGGMAFLPADDSQYDQLPYIEITEEEYKERKDLFDSYNIEWARVFLYEQTDQTTAAQTLACSAGLCEV